MERCGSRGQCRLCGGSPRCTQGELWVGVPDTKFLIQFEFTAGARTRYDDERRQLVTKRRHKVEAQGGCRGAASERGDNKRVE